VVVPAGFSPSTPEAPIGIPIGMEIMGLPWSEGKLLGIAAELEKIAPFRRMPVFANMTVDSSNVTMVPMIVPNKGNLSPTYPVGVLYPPEMSNDDVMSFNLFYYVQYATATALFAAAFHILLTYCQ